MKQYLDLVRLVLTEGTRKENRTGVDTLSYFAGTFRHDLQQGFPLLTTKKVAHKHIISELLWFLRGDTNIQFLTDNNNHIWDEWSSEAKWAEIVHFDAVVHDHVQIIVNGEKQPGSFSLDFAKDMLNKLGYRPHSSTKWVKGAGEVDAGYGRMWRNYPNPVADTIDSVFPNKDGQPRVRDNGFDQITWAVEELKKNPMGRRIVVTAWHPPTATQSKMSPCHYTFVLNVQNVHRLQLANGWLSSPCPPQDRVRDVYAFPSVWRKELCLQWTQRSCDIALGVPFNIASYAALCHIIARAVELDVGTIAAMFVDLHAYTSKPGPDEVSVQDIWQYTKPPKSKDENDHVPGLIEQLMRSPRALPKLQILGDRPWKELQPEDFQIDGYDPHPAIKFKVAV